MVLRTCLLVSDDPDDHIMFTEVLYEISSDIVLIAILDRAKALDLLSSGRHLPDYLILDLSNSESNTDLFFTALEKHPGLERIPLIVYGEFSQSATIRNDRISAFLDSDFTYSRLRNMLVQVINPMTHS
jgi:response regulator RpfG family c-di-GMP phosphodiesterase